MRRKPGKYARREPGSMASKEAKLDRVFSEHIRRRTADSNGLVRCVTCKRVAHWKEVDCGHFIKRQYMSTRFDPRNCHAQCRPCNRHQGGCQDEMSAYIVAKYGAYVLDELIVLKHTTKKWTAEELDRLISIYTDANKAMEITP